MHHRLLIFAFALLCAAPLAAQETTIVTLASVSRSIRRANPSLAAAHLRIEEAQGRLLQSGILPNPELETSLEGNRHEGKFEIGISQAYPLTNRLLIEKTISQHDVEAAKAEVREVQRQLTTQARTLVVQALALRERKALLTRQAEVAKDFANNLKAAADKGEASPLDAAQARLEATTYTSELLKLAAEQATITGTLKPILGLRPEQHIQISGTLPPPQLPGSAHSPKNRPDYQAARQTALAASHQADLERARSRQDLEVGIFASIERTEDAPVGYENEAMAGIRLKFPLPWRNRNAGAIAQANARQLRNEKETQALAQNILLEISAARDEMLTWKKLIDEIQTSLIPLAAEQTTATEAAYQNGQTELQNVLRARAKQLDLTATRIDAVREFNLAKVRYKSATGDF